jgi:hypothetical protein
VSLFVCWALYPLALGLLCLGCGLLVEHAGGSLPGALLLPAGFAAVIVIAALATTNDVTAEAATPLVVAGAAAGFVLARRRRVAVDWWAVALAVTVFAVFGAPILLSGHATFAGYITLDDTSTFLGLTDRVMEHGRDLSGLQPSTYQRVIDVNLAHGYPVGALMPLGIGHVLLRQDVAWLFQPTIDFSAAMLALALYGLAAPVVRSRPVRAVGLFVAAQPALLYAYSLWTGIKEVAAAALIAAVAAFVATRSSLALAVAGAALLDVLGAAGAVWLVPALVAAVVLLRRRALLAIAAGALLALPAWLTAGEFLRGSNHGPFTSGSELGNLGRPLRFLQVIGIWPAGDFRLNPTHPVLAYALIAFGIAAAAAGLLIVARQRRAGPLVYASSTVIGLAVFVGAGSPWIAGKAYAMATPAVALLAAIALGLAWQRGLRVAAGTVAVLLVGGVLWSNVLAYHDAWLAPRDQLRELERIGSRFAGDGPALMTEYQPYGVRHFLRRLDAEGAAELRVRPVFLLDGTTLDKGAYADLDRFQIPGILEYRTLVLRRSPAESRPPEPFRLVWRGDTYEVWQRRTGGAPVLRHFPLGNAVQPGAVPRCADVRALAAAFPRATLVAPVRERVILAGLANGYLYPTSGGRIDFDVTVPTAARYAVWVGGSFRGELSATVDGRRTGSRRHVLNNTGQYARFGSLPLSPGRHRVTLRYGGPDAHPGSGGLPFALGPVVLEPEGAVRMISVPAARAASLCGRRLDWVEALG